MNLAVYALETASQLINCSYNSDDSCYIPQSSLQKNSYVLLMVKCSQDCNYALYTYWGNMEHLKPGSKIKFHFSPSDPTQLFHIDFKEEKFSQIRIVMKP